MVRNSQLVIVSAGAISKVWLLSNNSVNTGLFYCQDPIPCSMSTRMTGYIYSRIAKINTIYTRQHIRSDNCTDTPSLAKALLSNHHMQSCFKRKSINICTLWTETGVRNFRSWKLERAFSWCSHNRLEGTLKNNDLTSSEGIKIPEYICQLNELVSVVRHWALFKSLWRERTVQWLGL